MSKFYRPNKPILKLQVSARKHDLDDIDSSSTESEEAEENEDKMGVKNMKADGVIVNKRMPTPNHLLLVALLEHLCSVYEADPEKSEKLFQALYRRLSKLKMLNPMTMIDELSTIKSQYKRGFRSLMRGALAEVNQELPTHSIRDRASILLEPRIGKDAANLSVADMLGFHTSRYRDEFVELGILGRGAYGSVYQARNKLDSNEYAVKKIIFQETNPEIWYKIFREVRHLASLTHPNIVRYFTAWVEQEPLSIGPSRRPNTPVFEGTSVDYNNTQSHDLLSYVMRPAITYPQHGDVSTESGDSESEEIISESTSEQSCAPTGDGHTDAESEDDSVVFEAGPGTSRVTVLEDGDNVPLRRAKIDKIPKLKLFRVAMYIQMELCVSTLAEWISTRNADITKAKEELKPADCVACMRVMKQVMKAVQHIHAHNLMHRDLKPKNIFISSSSDDKSIEVKVGDFGLSRQMTSPLSTPAFSPDIVSSMYNPLASSRDTLTSAQRPMTPHPGAPRTPPVDATGNLFEWDMFTSGVGTTIYAAPEQLNGSQYSQKSDVYSLGLIMFEIHQVFCTAMERVHCLSQARHGALPDSFTHRFPVHSSFILRMLDKNPDNRPTVTELLHSELFKSKDEIIKDLTQAVKTEKDKVYELTQTVETQARELAALKRELAELKRTTVPRPFPIS